MFKEMYIYILQMYEMFHRGQTEMSNKSLNKYFPSIFFSEFIPLFISNISSIIAKHVKKKQASYIYLGNSHGEHDVVPNECDLNGTVYHQSIPHLLHFSIVKNDPS